MKLFSGDLLGDGLFRYLHILAGVTWIGFLYYFNLVQVPGLAAYGDEGKARNITIDKIARRALWWFRWASIATLATGILITGTVKNYFQDFMGSTDGVNHVGHDVAISIGMTIGILMAANVWMIIWKNQKVVLANAVNVLGGGEANADAPTSGRKALLASRQNMIFSVPMLFFMVGGAHMYQAFDTATKSNGNMLMMIVLAIVALFELNAIGIFGGIKAGNKLLWPYESHKNALITSGILWVVVVALSEVLLG